MVNIPSVRSVKIKVIRNVLRKMKIRIFSGSWSLIMRWNLIMIKLVIKWHLVIN